MNESNAGETLAAIRRELLANSKTFERIGVSPIREDETISLYLERVIDALEEIE